MTRVIVDREKCIGSGMCTSIAPRLFELDDSGVLVVLMPEVPPEDVAALVDATVCCPVGALAVGD